MKEEATPHLSPHAFKVSRYNDLWMVCIQRRITHSWNQFAHKIGKIGVAVESLVYLLTYAFKYPFPLYHMPGSMIEPGDKTGLIDTVLEV